MPFARNKVQSRLLGSRRSSVLPTIDDFDGVALPDPTRAERRRSRLDEGPSPSSHEGVAWFEDMRNMPAMDAGDSDGSQGNRSGKRAASGAVRTTAVAAARNTAFLIGDDGVGKKTSWKRLRPWSPQEASEAVQRTAVDMPEDMPRRGDWPELEGVWKACNPDPNLSRWLLALKIKGGFVVDGDGDMCALLAGADGPLLHGGLLLRQGDCLIRRGRNGRTQVFVPHKR